MPRRIVVLISGSGMNLQALIDASIPYSSPSDSSAPSSNPSTNPSPSIPAQIVLVLSNRKAAYGLERAKSHGIPTAYKALQPYLKQNPSKTREDYDEEVAKIVLAAKPDLVVLAGWMHVLSERFLSVLDGTTVLQDSSGKVEGKEEFVIPREGIPVINLHPALPGAFDGANAIERAFEAFQKGQITETGVMVHRVIKEVDRGEPILTQTIPFREGESLEEFEKRLHEVEWKLIVQATAIVVKSLDKS